MESILFCFVAFIVEIFSDYTKEHLNTIKEMKIEVVADAKDIKKFMLLVETNYFDIWWHESRVHKLSRYALRWNDRRLSITSV